MVACQRLSPLPGKAGLPVKKWLKWYLYAMGVLALALGIGVAVKFRHHAVPAVVFVAAGVLMAFGFARTAYRYGRRKADGGK
jgi:hypothetical protein